MIRCVTGKPGDGKGIYLVSRMLDVLAQTDRVYVVTNENLILDKVHEHVAAARAKRAEREGDEAIGVVDLDKRLRVIPKTETFEYWRFRSGGLELDHSPDWDLGDDGARRIQKREFDEWMLAQFAKLKQSEDYQWPVYYFISEAHEYFPAREWQRVGRGVLYHATKHRHLWDEMWLETQTPEQMDKAMCRLVSESAVCRNNLRRNIGLWKARPVFRVRHFYGLPNGSATPFETTTVDGTQAFRTAGQCYRTTGAFGVHSKPEKILNRGKLPWWSMWAAAFGAMLLVVGLCFAGPQILVRQVGSSIAGAATATAAAAPAKSDGESAKVMRYLGEPVSAPAEPAAVSAPPSPASEAPVPRVVGVMRSPSGLWCAQFEDGSRCYPGDGLDGVRPGEVRIRGRWVPVVSRPVSEDERQAVREREQRDRESERSRSEAASVARREMLAAAAASDAAEQAERAERARFNESRRIQFFDPQLSPDSSSSILSQSQARAAGLPMIQQR